MRAVATPANQGTIVITGGAGFIGSNLAHALLQQGWRVALLDNLSRPGVERNVDWLSVTHGNRVQLTLLDVRDATALRRCLGDLHIRAHGGIAGVFHFAAQVAVTASLTDPLLDFQVNALGTLNLLEALRELGALPPLIFTSTNKVYGCLTGLATRRRGNRYEPEDPILAAHGIDEQQPLDFQSPYGCSKGTADQYVLEYARSFGLPATVFRMSCIYGPHQFGTEDQGWIAHFLVSALEGQRITVYGDGCQVRDALYIDDLVRAFELAFVALRREARRPSGAALSGAQHGSSVTGQAFNIGGGPARAISLLDLLDHISILHGRRPETLYGEWRLGDQRYYVSNTRKFSQTAGWQPRVRFSEGVSLLYAWLAEQRLHAPKRSVAAQLEEPALQDYPVQPDLASEKAACAAHTAAVAVTNWESVV